MTWDAILTLVIIGIAGFFVFRKIMKQVSPSKSGCGGGCGNCKSQGTPPEESPMRSEEVKS